MWIDDVATNHGLAVQVGAYNGIAGVAVFNRVNTERYVLEKRWQRGKRIFVAFMMNPSKAAHNATDQTVDQMITLAQTHECDALHVINVSSIITGNSGTLNASHFQHSTVNWDFIEEAVKSAEIVFISWGIKGQQGINQCIAHLHTVRQVFMAIQEKLFAYDVLVAVNEQIDYVPHPRPIGAFNRYVNTPIRKITATEFQRLF